MDEVMSVFLLIFAFFAIIMLLCIIGFVLQGIPLYKMAKNRGMQYPWLAFVPYGCNYIMLNIPTKPFNLFNFFVLRDRMTLFLYYLIFTIGGSFIVNIFAYIPVVGIIITIAYLILSILVSYQITKDIYDTYETDNTTLLAVLSMFIPFMQLILMYVYMNREPIYPNNLNNNVIIEEEEIKKENYNIDNEDKYDIDINNDKYNL